MLSTLCSLLTAPHSIHICVFEYINIVFYSNFFQDALLLPRYLSLYRIGHDRDRFCSFGHSSYLHVDVRVVYVECVNAQRNVLSVDLQFILTGEFLVCYG